MEKIELLLLMAGWLLVTAWGLNVRLHEIKTLYGAGVEGAIGIERGGVISAGLPIGIAGLCYGQYKYSGMSISVTLMVFVSLFIVMMFFMLPALYWHIENNKPITSNDPVNPHIPNPRLRAWRYYRKVAGATMATAGFLFAIPVFYLEFTGQSICR